LRQRGSALTRRLLRSKVAEQQGWSMGKRVLLAILLVLPISASLEAREGEFADRESIRISGYCAGVLRFVSELSQSELARAEHRWQTLVAYDQAIGALVIHAKQHHASVGLSEEDMVAVIVRGMTETVATQNINTAESRLEVWDRGTLCFMLGLALDVGSNAMRPEIYATALQEIGPLVVAGD